MFRARLYVRGPWPKVLSWYANELGRQFFLDKGKQTTNLASISLSKLKALPVPVMSSDEAARILIIASQAFAVIDNQLAEGASQARRKASLRQSVLKAAFSGELVAQVPRDEPASALLERIAAERAQASPAKPRRTRKHAARPSA